MNPMTKLADVQLRVEMPAGSESVLGPPQPFGWNIDVTAALDPSKDSGVIVAKTTMGSAQGKYQFMRSLPQD